MIRRAGGGFISTALIASHTPFASRTHPVHMCNSLLTANSAAKHEERRHVAVAEKAGLVLLTEITQIRQRRESSSVFHLFSVEKV